MKPLLTCIALISFLSGCNSQSIRDFTPSDHITDAEQQAGVALLPDTSAHREQDTLNSILTPLARQGALERCGIPRPEEKGVIAPALFPIVASAGKYIFDSYMDKKTNDAKKLKKASTASYSAVMHKTFSELAAARCIVVYRENIDRKRTEKQERFPFVALLAITPTGDNKSFTFSPFYVRAHNTVSMTKKLEAKDKDENDKINASFAISVKTVATNKNGMPGLEELGTDVVTVEGVKLGQNAQAYTCSDNCVTSDFIPVLQNKKAYASIKVAVTESGILGIKIDDEIAEYEAFKEAFSDPLKESINTRLNQLYGE